MYTILFIIVLLTSITSNIYSQTWKRLILKKDSTSEGIHNICFNPQNRNTILAFADGVIYRTYNAGITWDTNRVHNPYISSFQAIATSPVDSNLMIAAPSEFWSSIFITRDQGITWQAVALPKLSSDINDDTKYAVNSESIYFDKETPSTVYIGLSVISFTKSKIESWFCKSTNNGANWDTIYNFTRNNMQYGICGFSVNSKGEFFQGAVGGKIYNSIDKGKNWKVVYSPPVSAVAQKTPVIKFSINNPNIGFATQTNSETGLSGGLLKTVDGGNTWFKILSMDTSFWALELVEDGDKIELFTALHSYKTATPGAFVIKCNDGGYTWTEIDDKLTPWHPKSGRGVYKILFTNTFYNNPKYYFATEGGFLTYTPTVTTNISDELLQSEFHNPGISLLSYLEHIRLRLDIERISFHTITGQYVFGFDTIHDGDQVSQALQELAKGTYYAVAKITNGKTEFQSLIQY